MKGEPDSHSLSLPPPASRLILGNALPPAIKLPATSLIYSTDHCPLSFFTLKKALYKVIYGWFLPENR